MGRTARKEPTKILKQQVNFEGICDKQEVMYFSLAAGGWEKKTGQLQRPHYREGKKALLMTQKGQLGKAVTKAISQIEQNNLREQSVSKIPGLGEDTNPLAGKLVTPGAVHW